MGYTTNFKGQVNLSHALTEEQSLYLRTFNRTRRMKRSPEVLQELFNGEHGLSGQYGLDGMYFCRDDGRHGQSQDKSILDYNSPPDGVPGLWCQWVPNDEGTALEWDEGEKFYRYTEWMKFIIEHFLTPWGIVANGEIKWQGKDFDDRGKLIVVNNAVSEVELE
jgi:hypothetical protein